MCGIAGIFHLDGQPVSPVALRRMTDAIHHRGPDGEGYYNDGFIGLGHRRLAIIDLTRAGHQPMVSEDGKVALVYNGEIYNFENIRLELESKGYVFRSRTDSEVVLNAWYEWGEESVLRFNGMFAFAVWDRRNQSLFIARDRYGIKPVYYSIKGNTFLFGSEQKAILAHGQAKQEIDRPALLEYMTFQNIFTDRTLNSDIKILPAGTIGKISVSDRGESLKMRKYWDYHFQEPDGSVSVEEYREELDRLLQQAVKRQLVTDVELGSYLSGGMDSGTITAIAATELPYIKTFTCGFDLSSASGLELTFDEREKAEAMSAKFRTEHYEMVLKAGDMERSLKNLVFHVEEPRVGQSYPNYYVSRLASRFVKVVLSGAGGDELFGGYPWRYYRASACVNFEDYVDKYYAYWQRLVNNRELKALFAPIWNDVKDVWTRDIFYDVFLKHDNKLETPEDYINHSLYFEAKTFMHGLFVIEDKLSMAQSLETRVPFLDNDLVDFAMRCPVNLKVRNLAEVVRQNENEPGNKTSQFYKRTNDGKMLLRDVMGRYIPNEIVRAEKQGFSAPDASWFKGDSIDFVRESLLCNNALIYDLFDSRTAQRLVKEHLDGKKNRRLLIWSLLYLEVWMRSQSGRI